MSEEALAKHIDDRMAQGDLAPAPSDPETQSLAGSVRLAQAALVTPEAPEHAERASRERVLSQMNGAGLSSRALHDDSPHSAPQGFWGKLLHRLRGGDGR
ncbi:hypothetical protein CCAX7_000990 [Capsulimonas corticalis]|uniref:Uncharacterized protein n=1 Tax=Capsulimonas corticalis TaxID=2219043 RepID=A0A402CRM5_9BACT|nr:hypothetical protein [Capsulimonas corticalis]BDI28048.1 hypothetical protein CCAX7_000990 [Capsulimonas corticalis]